MSLYATKSKQNINNIISHSLENLFLAKNFKKAKCREFTIILTPRFLTLVRFKFCSITSPVTKPKITRMKALEIFIQTIPILKNSFL